MKQLNFLFLITALVFVGCNGSSVKTDTSTTTDSTATSPSSDKVDQLDYVQVPDAEISEHQNKEVYHFDKEAILSGTLEILKYTDLIDEWRETYIFVLDKPIKVISKDSDYPTVENVKEVQIGFDSEQVKKPEQYLSKKITLVGTLYPEQNVHHRRPAIMVFSRIK